MTQAKKNPGAYGTRSGAHKSDCGYNLDRQQNNPTAPKRQGRIVAFTLERRRKNDKRLRALMARSPKSKWQAKPLPPLAALQKRFCFHPVTRALQYRLDARKRKLPASEFCMSEKGYALVSVNGMIYRAHRVAFKLHHGRDPVGPIDHINHIRADNRVANLRETTTFLNNQGRSCRQSGTGRVGVYFDHKRQKYEAQITYCGFMLNLGRFTEFQCAVAARLHAEKVMHPEFDPAAEQELRRAAR